MWVMQSSSKDSSESGILGCPGSVSSNAAVFPFAQLLEFYGIQYTYFLSDSPSSAVLQSMCVVRLCVLSHSVEPASSKLYGPQPTRLLCPWDFPGENTGDDCHLLLQGIFLTQGLNTHFLCLLQADSLLLSHWELDEHYFYFTPGKVSVIKYHVQIQRLKKKRLTKNKVQPIMPTWMPSKPTLCF